MPSTWTRLYRRIRYGKPIVVVSGLPRSGTSMTMKMLEAGGMEILSDGVRTADEDNPKGYFELERVKSLDKEEDKRWLGQARGKAVKVISFLLKGLPRDNNYKVLFMHRNIHEVLASQGKMLARRGETSDTSDEQMIELYEKHLKMVQYDIQSSPHLDVLDIHYKEVLEKPREWARRMRDFTGADLDVERMATVVDEQLYRNRR